MLALVIAYPLLVHASILWPEPWLRWAALAVLCALPIYGALRAGRWWAWALFLAALAASAALVATNSSQLLLYLPPVLIPLALLMPFARSLRAGQEPLITRMARISRGGVLPPDLAPYTRGLTILWTAVFALMIVSAILLTLFAPLHVWSIATNFVHYFVIGALIVGEYLYRRWRFRHLPHPGFFAYLRLLAPRART
jgi:uncharacterized membrane protein